MVTYMPILKGRKGEFTALAHLPAALVPHVMPMFEIIPTADGPTKDAYRFGNRVRESVPADLPVAVDARYLADPAEGMRRPLRDIAEDLAAWGILMLPVLHPYDTEVRLADARYALDLHGGRAIFRLGDDTRDPDDREAEEGWDRLRDKVGLAAEDCRLVLDVSEVGSERDLTRVEPIVRKCASWARRYPWHSVTVAAGAMPQSISHLPVRAPTPLRRWDLELWRRVRDLGIRYADYGVAHPGVPGGAWRPMPSLRYTGDEVWWIYRWPRVESDRPAMYDLCEALVAADHWPPEGRDLSWGDGQIAARARGVGGPGNPTNWRAWTTSHHIAQVTAQLGRWRPGMTIA